MRIARRGFIAGMASLIVAPSIVRASNLMPVKVWKRTVRSQLDGLSVGTIITIGGVEAWDRLRQCATGQLRQFVITACHSNHGDRGLSIYPPVEDSHHYQTVVSGPKPFAEVFRMERHGEWVTA